MAHRLLALVENTIGTRLLISTTLRARGYEVAFASSAREVLERLEVDRFESLLLDAARLGHLSRRAWRQLAIRCGSTRVAWIGRRPRRARMSASAVFRTPLDYGALAQHFSEPDADGEARHCDVPADTTERAVTGSRRSPCDLAPRRKRPDGRLAVGEGGGVS